MKSKLFRAIVGVGIALGAAGAGCTSETATDGSTSPSGEADGASDRDSGTTPGDDAPAAEAAASDVAADAHLDAATADAGSGDASSDDGRTGDASTADTGMGDSAAGDTALDDAAAEGAIAEDAPQVPGDATPADATPLDALLDAFCDATWPTTKGNGSVPACVDPLGECAALGVPMRCMPDLGSGACDPATTPVASTCVSSGWQCPVGFISIFDCSCWGVPPVGSVCMDGGFQPADAGAGGD